jgi:hypothetical protein
MPDETKTATLAELRDMLNAGQIKKPQENGGPAFPVPNDQYPEFNGMSLRDWFAGNASEDDVFTHRDFDMDEHGTCIPRRTREQAKYAYADAMIEARKGGAA